MRQKNIRWGLALGGALAAEAALVAAAIAWVTIYSYMVRPGQSPAFYRQYALLSGPWVSLITGVPVFYLAGRLIAKTWPTAMVLFGVYLLIDVTALTLLAGANPNLTLWRVAVSYLLKLLACHFGAKSGASPEFTQAA